MSFTAAGGGFSVGNGTNYVYCTKFQNLAINGNGLCANPLRFRMSEEADLLNVSVLSATTSCITVSGTSLFTSRHLALSSSPIGVQIGNGCGYLSFLQSNLYLLTEPFQITGTQLTRFVFTDGWTEMCPDFITIKAPGLSPSIGEILVNDSYFTSTLTNNRVFRAVAASSISMVRCRILGCYFNLPSGTSPLVDFTAVNNTSDIHLTLNDLDLTMAAALGSQVLVKPHASQAWYLFYVDAQRIAGVSANQWSAPPCVTGGVRSAPSELQGTGTPQGQVTAFPGSTYRRLDGGAGTSFYVKETGTGNTGWVAK